MYRLKFQGELYSLTSNSSDSTCYQSFQARKSGNQEDFFSFFRPSLPSSTFSIELHSRSKGFFCLNTEIASLFLTVHWLYFITPDSIFKRLFRLHFFSLLSWNPPLPLSHRASFSVAILFSISPTIITTLSHLELIMKQKLVLFVLSRERAHRWKHQRIVSSIIHGRGDHATSKIVRRKSKTPRWCQNAPFHLSRSHGSLRESRKNEMELGWREWVPKNRNPNLQMCLRLTNPCPR